MIVYDFLFTIKSTHASDIFRERTIRIIVLVAALFFSILFFADLLTVGIDSYEWSWYLFIYSLSASILTALFLRRVNLAANLLVPGVLLILIDPTAAYWSPGTVILSLLFAFMFQLLLIDRRIRISAMVINIAIYTYLAILSQPPSLLPPSDYFASPLTAILAVYMSHAIIVCVSYYIRREQELRDQQALLLEQQRVEVLRQFLGHSSHDLRTLLSRISSSLYIAKRRLPENKHEALDGITDASDDLQKLILSMLDMVDLQGSSDLYLESSPLDSIIKAAISRHHDRIEQMGHTVQFNSQTTFVQINADVNYIHRALANIIHNAVVYTPEPSKIGIHTRIENNYAIINVTDTGIVIPEDKLPYIFDSFYRGDDARNQSTGLNGLGLSISKKIIELHGGSISVKSEVGVGSTFTIRLPMV